MDKPRSLSLGKDYTPNGPHRPRWQNGFCSRAGVYPLGPSLVEHFERCVDTDPEAPALLYGEERLSYRQLDERTNQLAHLLRRRGVGVGDLVGILVERSADLPIAMLAILKAGGAYVPLDPTNPPQRWSTVIGEARLRLLIAHHQLAASLPTEAPGAPPDILRLDREQEALAAAPSTRLALGIDDSCLAYLLFTSGSTGKPKGVLIHQRAVVRLVLGEPGWPAPRRRIAQFSSAGFDASTLEIWGALLQGGSLIGVMKEHLRSLDAFADLVLNEGIEEYYATPLYFAQLLETRPEVLGQLRLLNLGGDRCHPKLLQRIREAFGGSLVHGYGPTECTSLATALEVETVDDDEIPVPIGFPLAGTEVALFDDAGQLVLDAEPGELYLGGDGLSLGYFDKPALTAEKFVPHPGPGAPGRRLYRTGDLVRRLPSGALEFLGRVDSQVKIRGYRIEPGEVEKALLRHAAVREAAVIPREVAGETRLVAYFVPVAAAPKPALLRDFLLETLPEYMVPAAFVHMGALPRTLGDKIDRRVLPAPDAEAFAGADHLPPTTAVEKKLAALWSELLGVPEIGLKDDFFQLGGHSLLVGRLASALRQLFGIELPMGEIFDHPRLEDQAACIERRQAGAGDEAAPQAMLPPLPPIPRMPRDGRVFPLSFPQERVWLIQQLEQGSIAYNFQACLFFRGHLDVHCLERALSEIVRRHEVFHTGYQLRDGRPVMVIEGPFLLSLPVLDLREFGPAGAIARAEELFEAETRQAFDLSHPPLIRFKLYRLAEESWALLQVEHHFVHDGWSLSVLARELQTLYRAYVAGQSSPLPELEIQFPDFAAWQRREIAGERLERLKAWWRRQLDGMPQVLELPSDRPRPDRPSSRGDSKQIILPRQLYQDLRAFSRENGATLYMTMLAAFTLLMQRYSGQNDLAIGSGVANRSQQAQHGMIGMVVNSIVLRCRLKGDPSFHELLTRIRRSTIESYEHQDMPFEQLVSDLRPERHISRNPLFQVMFSFHDAAVPAFDFGPGLKVWGALRTNHSAKTDLNIIVAPQAEQQVGQNKADRLDAMINWEYNSELFNAATIKRMIRHYLNLLRSAVDQPDRPISRLAMISPQEREQLKSLACCPGDYPREASLVELWRQVAARHPAAVAVVAGGKSLRYDELAARATRLAELLVAGGLQRGELVGLALERGIDLVVGVLGILAAGGAYVPLDAAYPQERLELLASDTGMRRVLTQSRQAATLPAGLELVLLDELEPVLAEPPSGLPLPKVDGGFPAYVVYTSGSTGRPKGVVVPQRAVSRLALGTNYVELGPGVRVLQAASAAFDAITFELWAPLLHGGTVVVVDRETLLSPADFAAALIRQPVDIAFFTTAFFQQLARERPAALASIGTLLFGGERCEPAAVRALAAGPSRVEHVYGPTECTTFALFHAVAAVPEGATSVPIGLPLRHTEAWVVDEALELCPLGVAGELLLGGDGLAFGYHRQPALTAEKFVPHPFSVVPGARLYRSGDRVRRLPGGEVDFLGRFDHQIKLRGFRIELGEIEASLGRLPEVAAALVLLREDRPGDRRLVAYVTLVPHAATSAETLRFALRSSLPDYTVPSEVVVLEAFPLTNNGKIDRKALPAPERTADAGRCLPETTTEIRLAALFRELLELEEVALDDDFFSLGGHSLLASLLAAHVAAELGKKLTLAQIFAASTVREMAALLDQQAVVEPPKIPRRNPAADAEHLVAAAEGLDEKALDALLNDLGKE